MDQDDEDSPPPPPPSEHPPSSSYKIHPAYKYSTVSNDGVTIIYTHQSQPEAVLSPSTSSESITAAQQFGEYNKIKDP